MQLTTYATVLCLLLGHEEAPREASGAQPPTVASVFLKGCSSLPAATVRELLGTKPGAPLGNEDLERDREAILDRYHEAGHLLASVASDVAWPTPDRALVTFTVHEGPPVSVGNVEVLGNEGISRSEVMAALQLGPPGLLGLIDPGHYRPSAVANGLETLRRLYISRGYFRAAVGLEAVELGDDLRSVSVTLRVEEGPRFTLEGIQVVGHELFPDELLVEVLDVETGGYFSGPALEAARRRLVRWYQEHSDRTPEIRVVPVLEDEGATAVFQIEEGTHRFVGEVSIGGNWKTRDRVIRDRLLVVPGGPLTSLAVEESRKRIADLGYFETVEVATQPTDDPAVEDIEIRVKEKEFTGLVQIGGGASSGEGGVGYFGLRQTNFDIFRLPPSLDDWRGAFAGGGQAFQVEVMPGSKESRFHVGFIEPYFFSSDRSLELGAYSSILEREAYQEDRIRGQAEVRQFLDRDHRLSAALAFVAERVDINDLDAGAPPDVVAAEGRTFLAYPSLSMRLSDLDTNAYSGPDGLLAEVRLDVADSVTGSQVSFTRASGGVDVFQSFFDDDPDLRHSLHVGVRAGWADGSRDDELPLYERWFVGGPRTFRGFYYRRAGPHQLGVPVGGGALLRGTVEYSLPVFFRELRVVALFDWGNLEPSWGSFSTARFRTAVGGGLQIRLPVFGQILPANLYWTKALARGPDDREQLFAFTLSYGF